MKLTLHPMGSENLSRNSDGTHGSAPAPYRATPKPSEPSEWARATADQLSRDKINQIIEHLEASIRYGGQDLTPEEDGTMRRGADALKRILSWQSPKEGG